MSASNLLAATGLAYDYGRHRGVADIDLALAPGEVVGLLGVNGAGKSTILQLLAGTLGPAAGRVEIAGHDLARAPTLAKRHIGYLAERPALYRELSVDESLDLAARLQGLPRAKRADAVAAAKRDTDIQDLGRRLIGGLSKGMAQRVGLAQAIVHRPALLLLDEPTSGLDPSQLHAVRALIARLSTKHAVIISSHLLAEIQAMANRVVIVAGGRIVSDRPAADPDAPIWIELQCARPPSAAHLSQLLDGAAVQTHAPGTFRIPGPADASMRERLADLAHAHDWGLIGLAPVADSLEQRFMQATGAIPQESQT